MAKLNRSIYIFDDEDSMSFSCCELPPMRGAADPLACDRRYVSAELHRRCRRKGEQLEFRVLAGAVSDRFRKKIPEGSASSQIWNHYGGFDDQLYFWLARWGIVTKICRTNLTKEPFMMSQAHPPKAERVAEGPLVTVVMCVYNAGKYFRPSLLSIIDQTYKNLDILIIDDGSTDGCFSSVQDLL